MVRKSALRPLLVLALATCVAGCVDPEGSFESFNGVKAASTGGTGGGDGGPCAVPKPGEGEGDFLVAVSSSLGPTKPILYEGSITTPTANSGSGTAIFLRMAPLVAADRKTRLDQYEKPLGPFAIATDGSLSVAFPRDTIPGEANPIIPNTPAESEATLSGFVCGVQDFYCGTLEGHVYSPVDSAITGTFGMMRLKNGLADLPLDPIYIDCAKAVADPL